MENKNVNVKVVVETKGDITTNLFLVFNRDKYVCALYCKQEGDTFGELKLKKLSTRSINNYTKR